MNWTHDTTPPEPEPAGHRRRTARIAVVVGALALGALVAAGAAYAATTATDGGAPAQVVPAQGGDAPCPWESAPAQGAGATQP